MLFKNVINLEDCTENEILCEFVGIVLVEHWNQYLTNLEIYSPI